MDSPKWQRLKKFLSVFKSEHRDFDMNDMKLHEESPHPLAYVPTHHTTKNTHDGQMKLLMADETSILLGLLHICSTSQKTWEDVGRHEGRAQVAVVVAGAAPGDHFLDLSNTFRLVDFHLYDPAPRGWYSPLAEKCRQAGSNVRLYRQKFELQTAEEWADRKGYGHVIFLSDLRTQGASPFPSPDAIAVDMENQKEMTKSIKASYSVLKFRPRYFDDTDPKAEAYRTLEYFDGTVYLQGYPPKTSTETRLHVTDTRSVKSYDTQVYQDQLFYHNQVTRNKYKVRFGPEKLSYDNAFARFVEDLMLQHLPFVSQIQRDRNGVFKFDHQRLRVLLGKLSMPPTPP